MWFQIQKISNHASVTVVRYPWINKCNYWRSVVKFLKEAMQPSILLVTWFPFQVFHISKSKWNIRSWNPSSRGVQSILCSISHTWCSEKDYWWRLLESVPRRTLISSRNGFWPQRWHIWSSLSDKRARCLQNQYDFGLHAMRWTYWPSDRLVPEW